MNSVENRHPDEKKTTGEPYEDLYIYYLRGRMKQNHGIADRNFLGAWEEDGFSFLFFSKPSHEKMDAILRFQPQLTLLDKYHIPYSDWHGEKIAPFKSGSFFISPPWEKTDSKKQAIRITLDPGVVFGTGIHPTTKDCLEALEMVFGENGIESAIDLGTGTGLLSLAAAGLGCKRALAVDINFLAARTAMKNILLNGMENKILAVQGRAEEFIDCHSDLVIANIHYDVMKYLVTSKGFLSKKWFILSGLFRSQARDVVYTLSRFPVQIIKNWEGDGIWHTLLGKVC